MAPSTSSPRTRHWSDLLAIVTGVALIAYAMWPGGPTASPEAADEKRFPDAAWLLYFVTGVAAVAAVAAAQKWKLRTLARGMLAVSGLALIAFLFVVSEFTPRTLLPTLVPGLALLAAAVGIGPMPRDLAGPEYGATRRQDLDREVPRGVAMDAQPRTAGSADANATTPDGAIGRTQPLDQSRRDQ